MDVHFKILGSSSSGNAALLQAAGSSVLIDAGMSGKKLELLLNAEGLSAEALDAVFLTHEHNDHSAGVRGLSKFGRLPFFANQDTIRAIQPKLQKRPNWKVFETGKPFDVFKILIYPNELGSAYTVNGGLENIPLHEPKSASLTVSPEIRMFSGLISL